MVSRDTRLLSRYVRALIESTTSKKRVLRIFDFDDTLVKTDSRIHVLSASGDKFSLTSGEYAVYAPQHGDEFDYSDFSKLVNPSEIKWTTKILKRIIAKGGEVVILTARGDPNPIRQFISDINIVHVDVVALGDSDPQKKAEYISRRLDVDDFNEVEFFDDSYKNILAVANISPDYPHVKIITRHVTHAPKIS